MPAQEGGSCYVKPFALSGVLHVFERISGRAFFQPTGMHFMMTTICTALLMTGCAVQSYRPAPLSPIQAAASLEARSLTDPHLHEFMIATSQLAMGIWPLPEWDLADLTLAAFYYNPTLQIAWTRVAEAEARIITANAKPNPSFRGDIGGETAPESPWIAGLGFSLPIETAGKRGFRITAAERLADVARWNLASTAWKIRSQVRVGLIEYLAAKQILNLLQVEEQLRAEQVQLLEQRLKVGMIPRPEVDTARIQQTQTLLEVEKAEGRIPQAQASLAAAIGVPTTALKNITIAWTAFNQFPSPTSLTPAKIQEDAVLNRLDIRRALAAYSASEAALRVEIAEQYPDFDLGPEYAFEEATHLFTVAIGLTLPVFKRNQGPIAEAKAARQEMAAQFLSVQAAGIAHSEEALAQYSAALKELAQARQILQQTQTREQAAQEALEAGQSDRVELNCARLQTAIASAAQFDALYKTQQAMGDLEDAVQRPLLPGDIQPLSLQSPALHLPARK